MPGGMSCSWERRLAENLTNADHMRDLRQRIDTEHEVKFTTSMTIKLYLLT